MMNYIETNEQIRFINYIRTLYPKIITIVCPIVSYGTKIQRIKFWHRMRAMGYTRGTPDIFIARPIGEYSGLFIEMKSKDGVIGDHQIEIKQTLESNGYKVDTCFSCDDAISCFEKYMKNK